MTALYSSGLCVIGFIVLRLFGEYFIRFFINDPLTIEAGSTILRIFIWGIPVMGIQVTLMVSFQAFGKPVQALVINMGRQLLLYIPLLYILNDIFGFYGFLWAQPTADILTTGIAIALGFSLVKLMRGAGSTVSHLVK